MALPLMTQGELVGELAERTGWTRGDVKHVLSELEEVIHDNLKNCVRTKIAGVTVYPHLSPKTKRRPGRNPATGEEIMIAAKPASATVKAKVDTKLKGHAPSTRKLQNAQ